MKCKPAVGAAAEEVEGEPWDKAFNAERLRERLYSYSEEELKKHFELADVLKGLFRITSFLFGVEVEELTGERKPSVWHEDVRFFAVREAGEEIAYFYLDPYVRTSLKSGGAWMNDFGSKRPGHLPVAVIVLNLPLADENGKCFMPMREVETLFHEFGHALQHMLTRVEEEDAAGINLVEWDAVEVASQFMENWCLDERTGISVPEDLKAKVKAPAARVRETRSRSSFVEDRRSERGQERGICAFFAAFGAGGPFPQRVHPYFLRRLRGRLLRVQVGGSDERRLLRSV